MPPHRTVGRAMVAIGCAGVVVGLIAVIVGVALIGQVENSVDDSLVLTSNALEVVTDSINVTSTIVTTVRTGVSSIASTLDAVTTSADQTSTAIATSTEFIGGSLPDALDAVGGVLPTIESIASSIDTALRVASRAPFGPNYDPAKPFDEAIAELSHAIGPLPEQLRSLSRQFSALNGSSKDIGTQLAVLADNVDVLDQQLGQVSTLIARYSTTADDAKFVATRSRLELQSTARGARVLLVLLGAVFALGQIVPIWLGSALARGSDGKELVAGHVVEQASDLNEPAL